MDSIQNPASRQKDTEFWFEDGTIILVVQNTEFRVYKGLLTEHSPIFRDMFSIPQTPASMSSDEYVGTCPVVRLSGDSARDWRHLLRLYMPRRDSSFLDQTPAFPPFELLSAYVRLAHKYSMGTLYARSMAHLKAHYTDSLRDWLDHGLRAPPGWDDVHALGVVNLARRTGEHTLLPTALWMCCRLGPELLTGFTYSDGEAERLDGEDLEVCWAARPRLMQATLATFLRIFPAPAPETCARGPGADEGCRRFAAGFVAKVRNKPGIFTVPDPFIGYISMDGPSGKRLCEGCREAVRETSLKLYYEVWQTLPELVGVEVPGWGEGQE